MATAPDIASRAPADRKFDFASLARTAVWGIGAAVALFVAVLAGLSDTGSRRIAAVVSPSAERPAAKTAALEVPPPKPVAVTLIRPSPATKPQPEPQAQLQPQPTAEARRLQEQVRLLVADQDRLIQRIGALERNLDDVTGSIRRQESEAKRKAEAAQAAGPSGPVSTVSWPAIITAISTSAPAPDLPPDDALSDTTASIPPGTPVPPPRPVTSEDEAAESAGRTPAVPTLGPPPLARQPDTKQADANPSAPVAPSAPAKRIVHGIDLGGASSVERLRTMWRGLQSNEASLLQGLRPLAFMSGTRRGRPDVRLIAGPVASAKEAIKLCSALLNAGRYCEPTAFAGHRLTSR
jgi:hypothetical protein